MGNEKGEARVCFLGCVNYRSWIFGISPGGGAQAEKLNMYYGDFFFCKIHTLRNAFSFGGFHHWVRMGVETACHNLQIWIFF